jgi:ubiquitin C-terminal hydrolase
MRGGHYVATTKSPEDDKWRLFNDENVKTISYQCEETAYLLFYKRVHT